MEPPAEKSTERNYSGGARAMLFILFLLHATTVPTAFLAPERLADPIQAPVWTSYAFGTTSLFACVFLVLAWRWRKWAVYGVFATTLADASVAHLFTADASATVIMNGVIVFSLYLVVRNRWEFFR